MGPFKDLTPLEVE
jgi:short-subunit dehydrogenase